MLNRLLVIVRVTVSFHAKPVRELFFKKTNFDAKKTVSRKHKNIFFDASLMVQGTIGWFVVSGRTNELSQ